MIIEILISEGTEPVLVKVLSRGNRVGRQHKGDRHRVRCTGRSFYLGHQRALINAASTGLKVFRLDSIERAILMDKASSGITCTDEAWIWLQKASTFDCKKSRNLVQKDSKLEELSSVDSSLLIVSLFDSTVV